MEGSSFATPENLRRSFLPLMGSEAYCDFSVTTTGLSHNYAVPSFLLMCESKFFEAVVLGDFKESKEKKMNLTLRDLECEAAFEYVVRYIFDGNVIENISLLSLARYISIADQLQMDRLLVILDVFMDSDMFYGMIKREEASPEAVLSSFMKYGIQIEFVEKLMLAYIRHRRTDRASIVQLATNSELMLSLHGTMFSRLTWETYETVKHLLSEYIKIGYKYELIQSFCIFLKKNPIMENRTSDSFNTFVNFFFEISRKFIIPNIPYAHSRASFFYGLSRNLYEVYCSTLSDVDSKTLKDNSKDVVDLYFKLCIAQFEFEIKYDDIFELSLVYFVDILKNGYIAISSEEEVLAVVAKYDKRHKKDLNEEELILLWSCVRYSQLSEIAFMEFDKNETVPKDSLLHAWRERKALEKDPVSYASKQRMYFPCASSVKITIFSSEDANRMEMDIVDPLLGRGFQMENMNIYEMRSMNIPQFSDINKFTDVLFVYGTNDFKNPGRVTRCVEECIDHGIPVIIAMNCLINSMKKITERIDDFLPFSRGVFDTQSQISNCRFTPEFHSKMESNPELLDFRFDDLPVLRFRSFCAEMRRPEEYSTVKVAEWGDHYDMISYSVVPAICCGDEKNIVLALNFLPVLNDEQIMRAHVDLKETTQYRCYSALLSYIVRFAMAEKYNAQRKFYGVSLFNADNSEKHGYVKWQYLHDRWFDYSEDKSKQVEADYQNFLVNEEEPFSSIIMSGHSSYVIYFKEMTQARQEPNFTTRKETRNPEFLVLGMESLIGIKGKDWVLLAGDTALVRSVIVLQDTLDRFVKLSHPDSETQTALGYVGEFGDCAQFVDYVDRNIALYEKLRGFPLGLSASAHFIRKELATALREKAYICNLLLGGVDKEGASLYFIDYLGTLKKMDFVAHGYAAMFVYSVLDRYYEDTLTSAEGLELMKKCISQLDRRYVIKHPKFHIKLIEGGSIRDIEYDVALSDVLAD